MRNIAIAVALIVLLSAVAVQAQTPAQLPKPGPEQKKLEQLLLGDWSFETEFKETPWTQAGTRSSSRESIRSVLGGFFLEGRSDEAKVQAVEIYGYDPIAKKYTCNLFASNGAFSTITYTIEGNTMLYEGSGMTGMRRHRRFRGTIVFAPDVMSSVDTREVFVDGKGWIPSLVFKGTKVNP